MFISDDLASVATGRTKSFLEEDITRYRDDLRARHQGKSVLVIGGAGSIGAALVRELWSFAPSRIDVVDLNENGLSTLARYVRGFKGIPVGTEFQFNPLDFGDYAMRRHVAEAGEIDVVYNFAAIKHVRSEKNVPCILHMLNTNVLKQYDFIKMLTSVQTTFRYFVVSTDKAANPSNVMGASKRLLEYLCFGAVQDIEGLAISSARFANVAFSNGSLLESFIDRLRDQTPLAAPYDTRRYFISPREAAEICLLGELKCPTGTIAIPKLNPSEHLVDLVDLAQRFLGYNGRASVVVQDPESGFDMIAKCGAAYPILATPRDTAGEKESEIFVGENEICEEIGLKALTSVRPPRPSVADAERISAAIREVVEGGRPNVTIDYIHALIRECLPNFHHIAGKARLDDRL